MKDNLRTAIIKGKDRWNDPSYLARVIFDEIIGDDHGNITGYGLAPYEMDNSDNPTIKVNLIKKTVNGKSFEQFVRE